MVCLGLEPGAAGWKAWTNPLRLVPHLYLVISLELTYKDSKDRGPKMDLEQRI